MTRPAAPVGWTPSLPRCCPQEEFWSFSYSHCNICADFFLIFTVQHLHFMEDFLHWKNATKRIDKSKLYSCCWPIVTREGKLGVICLGLACYSHWSGGRLIKSSCISICILFLCICICICLNYLLPLIDGKRGWSASTQEPQRYQTPFFVLKCCYTVKTVSPPFGDITST